MKTIDLRSDTVTLPSEEMLEAMRHAAVGDDIMGEDPTVKELEELSAAMLGKEAGLFVVSGTMGNQVAAMALTQRGDEVILGEDSHIYNLEVAALAALCQVQVRPISVNNGVYDPAKVENAIRAKGVQSTRTGLIIVENTYNLNKGIPVPLTNLKEIWAIAQKHAIPVHMDGARVFNAAAAQQIDVREITQYADTVQFCLTKGLACPFGSMLVGSTEVIEKARIMKQRLGGGFRQAGYLAAPGIVALKKMVGRLDEDHRQARVLAEGLSRIDGLQVNLVEVQTNIVSPVLTRPGITIDEFLARLAEKGIKAKRIANNAFRMIAHFGVEIEDVEYVIRSVGEVLQSF